MSKLSDHPVTVTLGILSSIVTLYVFFGDTFLRHIPSDTSTKHSDAKDSIPFRKEIKIDSLKNNKPKEIIFHEFDKEKYQENICLGKISSGVYKNNTVNLTFEIPNEYENELCPVLLDNESSIKCIYSCNRIINNKFSPIVFVAVGLDSIPNKHNLQTRCLSAFFEAYLASSFGLDENTASVSHDDKFLPTMLNGNLFYTMKEESILKNGGKITMTAYATITNSHLLSFVTVTSNEKEVDATLLILNTIKFN